VLVLCLSLGGKGAKPGIGAIAAVRRAFPKIRLIVYPDPYSPQTVRIAIALGAMGVVAKHEASAELVPALRSVQQGFRFVSPGIHRRINCKEIRRLAVEEELLLQLLADGNSLEEAVPVLQIPIDDARNMRDRAMTKLGMSDLAALSSFLESWRLDNLN
ncbi:hypothetical protein, partial [Mesorhizobium sp. M8A.F.Ca.ET.207.01.1.1]|uniref:hypothetical protein n=1 Tax=Mesorhizobium sp. M8A.F.Ca.ET.207.01.1.1 TaxID=2563968 RepID=UPI001AEE8ABF